MAHIYKISANIKILLNKIASLYSFSLLNNVHLQKSKKIMIDTDLNVAKEIIPVSRENSCFNYGGIGKTMSNIIYYINYLPGVGKQLFFLN